MAITTDTLGIGGGLKNRQQRGVKGCKGGGGSKSPKVTTKKGAKKGK